MLQLPPIEPDEQQPQWDYTISLADVTYRIVLTWRERSEGWYLSLYDASDVLLLDGKRLSIGWPALWRHTGRKIAGGMLALIDTTDAGAGAECGFEDLGHRCALMFFEDSEITNEREWWIPFDAEEVP